jgi:cellulose biosynthesis protein BcsQ
VSFAESAARGLTVLEIEPSSLASQEIETLTNEIMEFANK